MNPFIFITAIAILLNFQSFGKVNQLEGVFRMTSQVSPYDGSCKGAHPGSWSVPGGAPTGCDANNFGETRRAETLYDSFILRYSDAVDELSNKKEDKDLESLEVNSYISNMVELISELAKKYYLDRHPDAQDQEIKDWVNAVLSVSWQETKMSHYRLAPLSRKNEDENLKILMGDKSHSRFRSVGMMQIYTVAQRIKAPSHYFDLVKNINDGIERYYSAWELSKDLHNKKRCTYSNPIEHGVSAYSIYNGGPGSSCRWKRAFSEWRNHHFKTCGNYGTIGDIRNKCSERLTNSYFKHDLSFQRNLSTRPWEANVVKNRKRDFNIDLNCISQGNEICTFETSNLEPNDGRDVIYRVSSRRKIKPDEYCVKTDLDQLKCVVSDRDIACLNGFQKDANPFKVFQVFDEDFFNVKFTFLDRNQVCASAVEGLFKIGQIVKPKTALEIYETMSVQSNKLGKISNTNQLLQILDFYVEPGNLQERYYKVSVNFWNSKVKKSEEKVGYIYGGLKKNVSKNRSFEWDRVLEDYTDKLRTKPKSVLSPIKLLPNTQDIVQFTGVDQVKVLSDANIKSASVLATFSPVQELEVLELKTVSDSQFDNAYIKVKIDNKMEGYIYLGRLKSIVDNGYVHFKILEDKDDK